MEGFNDCDPGGYFICYPGKNNKKDKYKVISEFYKIGSIRHYFQNLENLSFDQLVELKNMIFELNNYYLTELDSYHIFPTPRPFGEWLDDCDVQMKKFYPWFYDNVVTMDESQEINGYKLYNAQKDMMTLDAFNEYLEMWKKNISMTEEEFEEQYKEITCTEWAKMDRLGNSYGGFWNFPEDSPEKNDAWNLTYRDNMIGLFELPYPKQFVLATIKMGCANRMECVRYSNLICEWYSQKFKLYEKREILPDIFEIQILDLLEEQKMTNNIDVEIYNYCPPITLKPNKNNIEKSIFDELD
jgi:hypothetical protein